MKEFNLIVDKLPFYELLSFKLAKALLFKAVQIFFSNEDYLPLVNMVLGDEIDKSI